MRLAIGEAARRRVFFVECAKALPLEGEGLGGGDSAQDTAIKGGAKHCLEGLALISAMSAGA
jgi:hypothetical protein